MELSLRYLWAGFIFLLAFLNLSARLASLAAETSVIPDGIDFVLYTENSTSYASCQGMWSCSSTLCNIGRNDDISYLILKIKSSHCGVRGISWIVRFGAGQASLAFLVLACISQIVVLFIRRQPRYYLYLSMGFSYLFLMLAYAFELLWTHRYVLTTTDRPPSMVSGWNFTQSICLLVSVTIANISLIPQQTYDPIN